MELRRRVGTAVASLAVATVIWLVVDNLDRSPGRLTVSLAYDVPPDVIVTEGAVREVEVRVLATKPKLRNLQPAEFDIRVPWRGKFGTEPVVLLPEDVRAPFGVTVEQVQPGRFTVVYDRKLLRSLPVRADVTGRPAEGHEIVKDQLSVVPSHVTIAGPAMAFPDDATVTTTPIDVAGRTSTLGPVRAALRPPPGGFSPVDATDVVVTVPIRPIPVRRTLDVEVEVKRGGWKTSQPTPRSARVVVEGPEGSVKGLGAADLLVSADASRLEPSSEDQRIEATGSFRGACPGCRILSVAPSKVTLRVRNARRPPETPAHPARGT